MKTSFFFATYMACLSSAIDLSTSMAEQDILAEIQADTSVGAFAEVSRRTCMSTHEMAIRQVDDFFSLVKKSTKYTD